MDIIDLQMWFYIVSIIFMVTLITVLVALLYVMVRIRQALVELQRNAVSKISSLTGRTLDVRSIAGFMFSTFVLNRVRKWFGK